MRAHAVVALAVAVVAFAGSAGAAPQVEIQNLRWFVVDGIGQGEALPHWQGVIDQAMADAKPLLQGDQGPADVPCCVDLRRTSVTAITAPTLQAVDAATDYDDMDARCAQAGGGSCAFLVDTISYCGGPSPTTIGCADTPECNQNPPDDDPTLVLVVSLDALADGSLAQTLAHERGHNACLTHVSANPCQLMRAATGGGCIDAAECGHLRDAGNAAGGLCPCQNDALATAKEFGACSDDAVTGGQCSGGVCGEAGSDASLSMLVSGGTASITGDVPDARLHVAGVTGGWTDLGATSGGVELTGMEYAASRRTTYAVTATDQLLRLDPVTGATLATIGTLPATGDFGDFPPGASSNAFYQSLAFDPGPSASAADDLLYAIRESESCRVLDPVACSAFCSGELVSVDPDDATTLLVGALDSLFCGGFPGLAYDSTRDRLYAAVAAGVSLYEIDLACPSQFCSMNEVLYGPDEGSAEQNAARQILARFRPTLAYSPTTDRLYRLGADSVRQIYDVFDAETLAFAEPIGIDGFTAGGLAAPEPNASLLGAAAIAACAFVARRRRR